ncbi:MAG: hypothetical protein JWP52_2529 [Rhizobacter sp.]|nr:hypothetical protein [Rhizobacter sp.]
MATRKDSALRWDEILLAVTRDVTEHPHDLSRLYCDRYGISRVTATKYIQRLEEEGWIARSGPATHPVFSPGFNRKIGKGYKLAGLDEQQAWENDFSPFVELKPNVKNILNIGFTEMLNNAIEHSAGTFVFCSVRVEQNLVFLTITDDGVGIFKKISVALDLPDQRLALLELSKGKFTTDPKNHSGEGVFWTSRMFDNFEILANGLEYRHDSSERHDWLEEDGRPEQSRGTVVFMNISPDSDRTARDVYDAYTGAPDDFAFSKTVVPLILARLGDENLVSRSQAKRLTARFDQFLTVHLDFKGIEDVGQGFMDELFRVYASDHPMTQLVPVNMTDAVERMYKRVSIRRGE